MVLRTGDEKLVLHAAGSALVIYDAGEWDAQKTEAAPLGMLTEADASALTAFLAYWLFGANIGRGPRGRTGARVDFDY
jgi:hypothetical protein